MHPKVKDKTVFTSGNGLWQFYVMSFGLWNVSTTIEINELVLRGLTCKTCLVYLGNIVVGHSKNMEGHLNIL